MGQRPKKRFSDEKGQAAIEFIAVIVVVFFFLLFLMSMSILLVVSDYMDYATFMAARTYKTGSSAENIQERNANIVFDSYLAKVAPEIVRAREPLKFQAVDEANVRTAGILSRYQIDMFYLPPLFAGNGAPLRPTLESEAHLGRDPTFEECESFFTDFAQRLGVGDDNLISQMEDNGC